jgi:phage minor structural protein
MKKELLYLYDLADNMITILNDNSEYPAHDVQINKKVNAVWNLTFKIFRFSSKIDNITNENIVKYEGEEYFIKDFNLEKSDAQGMVTCTCSHRSSSLEKQINEELDLIGVDCATMVRTVLDGSGWSIGDINVDSKYRSLQSKNVTRFSNLIKIADIFEAVIAFDCTFNKVNINKYIPDRNIIIRNNKNLKGISLKYNDDELVTKLYAFGANSDTGVGDVSIVDCHVENDIETGIVHKDGSSYITNFKYFLDKGYSQEYIDAHPEKFLHEQVLTLNDYSESSDLYDEAKKRLIQRSKPKMTCTINMLEFSKYPEYCGKLGVLKPVIGEYVTIIDDDINEIIKAQISDITESAENPMALKVTLVNFIENASLAEQLIDSSNKVQNGFNKFGQVKGSYIKGMLDVLSVTLGSTQSNYTGVNSDANGNLFIENTAKTQALKLGGGIFGLGSRSEADRDNHIDYTYRAFGTFDGFTANELVAGCLRGGKFYLDLDTGKVLFGNSETDYNLYYDGSNLKINLNAVDGLGNKLSTMQSSIDAQAGQISLNASSISGVDSKVTSVQLQVDGLSGVISSKVSSGDVKSIIQQSPTEVSYSFNNIAKNIVTINSYGITVNNGALILQDLSGKTIIDSSGIVAKKVEATQAIITGGSISFQISGVEKAQLNSTGNFIVNTLSARSTGGIDCLNFACENSSTFGNTNRNASVNIWGALYVNGTPITGNGIVAKFG